MTERTPADDDRALMRRIAMVMRGGTGVASLLLVAGAVLGWAGAALPSAAAVVAGCGVLILLPLGRLILMLGAFSRRRDFLYVGITALVIALVAISAATGLLR